MLSLLVGSSYEMLGEWGGPPDQNDWLSERAFFAIVLAFMYQVPKTPYCSARPRRSQMPTSMGKRASGVRPR
jgi:hypothetical protein